MGKLSEATVDTPKKQESYNISKGNAAAYVNRTQALFYSKTFKWIEKNVEDLVTAVDQYLRTWNNPTRTIKAGGLVERRNKRMIKILEYLKELEKKTE